MSSEPKVREQIYGLYLDAVQAGYRPSARGRAAGGAVTAIARVAELTGIPVQSVRRRVMDHAAFLRADAAISADAARLAKESATTAAQESAE